MAGQVLDRSTQSPHQTVISQIPTLKTHIWKVRSWTYLPQSPTECSFHRFLLWELIFGQTMVLGIFSIPPPNGNFTDSYSESSSFGRPGLGRSYHPPLEYSHFTDSYSESSYFNRPQVLLAPTLLSLSQLTISQISYSEKHIFWQTRYWTDLPQLLTVAISQIPTLRIHIW